MKRQIIKSENVKNIFNSINQSTEYFRTFGFSQTLKLNLLRQIEYSVSFYAKAITKKDSDVVIDAEYKVEYLITDYSPYDDITTEFFIMIMFCYKRFKQVAKDNRITKQTLDFIFQDVPDTKSMIEEIKLKLPSLLN